MGKPKKRKEYSLKKIVLMVFACSSLLCLLLIIFVTRISMKAMRESKMETINEQIQNIAQKKDTLCRRMYN